MEGDVHGQLPFLDVLVYRKQDGSVGHSVYRKHTHTDFYLNALSYHPAQKWAVLKTLVYTALAIADCDSLNQELDHLFGGGGGGVSF